MTREQWFRKGLDIGLSHLSKVQRQLEAVRPRRFPVQVVDEAISFVSRETQALESYANKAVRKRRLLGYRVKWDNLGIAAMSHIMIWDGCRSLAKYYRSKGYTKVRIVSVWRPYK